jgi:hypothetical protein
MTNATNCHHCKRPCAGDPDAIVYCSKWCYYELGEPTAQEIEELGGDPRDRKD